jgi:O-antigen/teichoic acid export membrane protein
MNWLKDRKTHVLADQMIVSGTNFLMTILLARHLDTSAFGHYAAYILIAYLGISALSAWGIQIFQVAIQKSSSYISFLVFWQFFLMGVMLTLSISINTCFNLYEVSVGSYLFIFGFIINDFGRRVLLSLDKTVHTIILDLFTSIYLITTLAISMIQNIQDLEQILTVFAYGYSFSLILIVAFLKPFFIEREDVLKYFRTHIKEGKWLFLSALSQWWAGNLFVVAAGIYVGATALAALRLAQSLFGVLNVLLQTFENYVLPQTAEKLRLSLPSALHYLKDTNHKMGLIFLPLLVITLLLAKPILVISGGNQYADFAYVVQGYSVLYIFIFLSQPLRFLIRTLQINDHFFYAYLINLGFSLITSHYLIFTFGLQGVIYGLIVSQIILMAYWSLILHLKNINIWKSNISY